MKHIFVNGITGHLGYVIAKQLKEKGYQVRGSMRNRSRLAQYPWLAELNIEIVEADLMDSASMEKALAGMDGFFQVAAVFDLTAPDPQKSVIEPNIRGTEIALRAAAKQGVKKIIYTSSIAAVGASKAHEGPKSESDWNMQAIEPYALSKALSEQRAWDLSRDLHLQLVSVLPGTILGPDFRAITPSVGMVQAVLTGKMPVALPMTLSFVDVRDVAAAHVLAYEHAQAKGRYIATNQMLSLKEFILAIKALRPKAPARAIELPLPLARVVPFFDYLGHKIAGAPRSMTAAVGREYFGRQQNYNSRRLAQEMGWTPRPVKDSLQDTIVWLEQHKF